MDRAGFLSTCTIFVLGTILSLYPSADARLAALPLPQHLRECYQHARNYSVENYVGGLYCWYCESPSRAYVKGNSPTIFKPGQYDYYRRLYSKSVEPSLTPAGRKKRQAQKCVRQELRMLTDRQRRAFFNAVNTLKRDTTVEPNKYGAIAQFHSGMAVYLAHAGPNFCGWHRIYLMLFEAALQEVDPTICLPYWDSTLESSMDDPLKSYLWSDDFVGSRNGAVTRGPLAGWRTIEGVELTRSVGVDGGLMTHKGIADIMSRNTYEEILLPDVDPGYSLEVLHGSSHIYVGGDMLNLDSAANDLLFFLHHAFIDYIWDLFREKMRNNGLDPEVYPTGPGITDYHLPDSDMGFGTMKNFEGYLEVVREGYEYQPSPECSRVSPDCGSKYLWCNVTISQCVPIDPSNPPDPTPGPKPKPCPSPRPQAYQNDFCIDGVCDVNQWVWVPVKMVSHRAPEFHDYQSYPVHNGHISKRSDIYEPGAYTETSRYIKPHVQKPRPYEHCEVKDGVGKIFVSSMGLSYKGHYKESAIIDQRLATSIGVTYIAVKDPGPRGATEVILRAHDQCGRLCHTACKIPGSNPPRYQACSGVVRVTPDYPKQYGQTYAKATLDVYDYASNSDCPAFKMDDFFLTFYCDYRDHLPWVEKAPNPITGHQNPRPPPTVYPTNPGQCRLSSQCTINSHCYSDSHARQCSRSMEQRECVNNCGRYAICLYGVYFPRKCPSGMHFDDRQGYCVRGVCHDKSFQPGPPTGGIRVHFPNSGATSQPSASSGRFGAQSYYNRLFSRFSSIGK